MSSQTVFYDAVGGSEDEGTPSPPNEAATEYSPLAPAAVDESAEVTEEQEKAPSRSGCLFALRAWKVRGFRLPELLGLLASLVLPTADAGLDWAVIYYVWYAAGHAYWLHVGLAVRLTCGVATGLRLGALLAREDGLGWGPGVLLGLLLGVPGLAPAAVAARALYQRDSAGVEKLLSCKMTELALEAPQTIMQASYGVIFGLFDPASIDFLLAISVAVSLVNAGTTASAFGSAERGVHGAGLCSRYGLVALVLRTAQAAALVFWIALLGCAVKGWAAVAVLLSALVCRGMVAEATSRSHAKSSAEAIAWSMCHLMLVGLMAAVFFGDQRTEGWMAVSISMAWIVVVCGRNLHVYCQDPHDAFPLPHTIACSVLLMAAAMGLFVTAEHMDNNYANNSMPVGGPGSGSGPDDPQYFDCHERTSGLYPAYLATALCVVLTPLYLALDPEYGCRGGTRVKNFEASAEAVVVEAEERGQQRQPVQEGEVSREDERYLERHLA